MRRELRQSSRTRSRFCPGCRRRWPCLVPAAAKSGASSAASVKSAGKGQSNPALASRFKVSRTVDGATPTRRAISLSPTPAVFKRGTSRTWRIVVLSAGIRSPCKSQRSGPYSGQQRHRLPGRHHPGMAGEIILEHRASSNRNGGRDHRGFAGELSSPGIRTQINVSQHISINTFFRSTRFSEPSFLREYGRCRAPRRSAGRPRSKRATR